MLDVVRTCNDCGKTKPLEAFTPIRGTSRYYGRCKVCRTTRAWERAHPGLRYADWVAEPLFAWAEARLPPIEDCAVPPPIVVLFATCWRTMLLLPLVTGLS